MHTSWEVYVCTIIAGGSRRWAYLVLSEAVFTRRPPGDLPESRHSLRRLRSSTAGNDVILIRVVLLASKSAEGMRYES